MLDQFPVHRTRFINYETDSGPSIPGLFNAVITGIGELSVWRKYDLIGRLKQSSLLTTYHDVFNLGPVSKRIDEHVQKFIQVIVKASGTDGKSEETAWFTTVLGFMWRATICRLLIAI